MNSQSLRFTTLFSAVCMLMSTAAFAVDATWVGGSTGNWIDAGNWSDGVPQTASDTATISTPVAVAVPSSVTVKTLTVNAPATLTVASGATLAFSNSGGTVINANADLVVDGSGDITFSMNGSTGVDYADIRPAAGKTVTLAARVTGAGIENNSSGTILLTNPNNTYAGETILTGSSGMIEFSDVAALGAGSSILWGSGAYYAGCRYTGGPATLARNIAVGTGASTGRDIVFQHAGAGTLTLGGNVYSSYNSGKAITFDIAAADSVVVVTGSISNGTGTLYLYDSGAGTLVLNGTLSYTGASNVRARRVLNGDATAATGAYTVEHGGVLTLGSAGVINGAITVNSGGTLAAEKGATFLNRTLNLNAGSTVSLNPSAADGVSLALPLTNSLTGAGVRLVIPAAATASAVTLPALIRAAGATLDIAAPALGTDSNKLFVQNFDPGPLPAWLTVNGLPASYDGTLGVVPVAASGSTYSLTALGPSAVPNDPTGAAVINAAGTAGGITLTNDPTAVFSLTQEHADNPATVDLGGQTLAVSVVAVAAAGNSLVVSNGTLTSQSSLAAPSGAVSLPSLPTAPIAWFDLADAATVITDASGRISQLVNKGSLGATLDAAVPAGNVGPLYVPNAVAGLGIARSDGVEPPQGLATLGNAGITSNVPRTVFLVTMRSPVSQNAFYALFLGPDADANQAFAIVERIDRTSFITMGNDLEGIPGSSPGHNVLTFITGQGGTPNAGEGFRNGVSIGTKTFALATVDNPIRLLNRPVTTKAFSGPGEVAEALVFNYTLSENDRAAVEAYLMQKWRVAASREDTLLALRNDNPSAELAVPAAVTDPYAATLALTKSGAGDVTLGGPLSFSGSTLIYDGSLAFDTPAGLTNTLAGLVAGSGALVKGGPGGLALAKPNTHAGGTAVQAGTLFPGANGSLGSGPVTVENGAALDIANAAINGGASFANALFIDGAGPDGLGALRNANPRNDQANAFKFVTLTGAAAVYAKSRFDVRSGAFDFGGHSLTVKGGSQFSVVSSAISNVTPSTAVQIAQGLMDLESSDFKGSAASSVSVASDAGINLASMSAPMQWSLQLADNAYFRVGNGGLGTNLNQWGGPVTLAAGTARLTAVDGGSATLTGAVGGDGGLLKEGLGWFWLLNSANTYAGATTVTQGTLYAVSPGSLGAPGAAALAVSDAGTFVVRAAASTSPDGWTDAEIGTVANTGVFTTSGTTSLGIDTVYEDLDYAAGFPYIGLKKFGAYKLTLTGAAPDLGALAVYDGELDLTATGSHNLHTFSAAVGASTNAASLAVLRLAHAALNTDDPGYNRAGPTLTVGSAANGRGVAYVGQNAVANGRLLVGNEAGSAGAVYQTGGSVTNTGGTANEAAVGASGYGCYRLDGGTLANKGSTQLGRNSGSTGLIEQRGGTLVLNPGVAPADGVVGDYYNGSFSTRAGVGVFLLSGGTFNTSGHSLQLGEWSGENTYSNGFAVFTIESNAQATVDSEIRLANRNGNPQAYVNLNGGELTARYFQKGGNNAAGNTAMAAISFNGGVLHVPSAGSAVSSLVRTGSNNSPALLNVCAGGAVIDTLEGGNISLDQPLRAPANFGVAGVTLTSPGAGYLAPPAVTFSGGNGTGATAVAEIDLGSGTLAAVRVTSPGVGYTAAPTVTLRGGGYTATASATATLGTTASGGLTKLGAGTLSLNAANTYTGPTVVSNGVLRLGAGNQTLASASPLTVAGGTLDLGGAALTNNFPVTLGSGRLVNGSVSAPAFVKTDAGTATLVAAPQHASATALHETYVRSLNPLVWYDPSDAATLTLDAAGHVTALLNKGGKPGMDAASGYVYTGTTALGAPLLATGALSYAVSRLPMIKIDGNDRGLASASNLGITGTAPRTVVTVLTRDSTATSALVCFGAPVQAQMFEVGDRMDSSSVVIGGYSGYDLTMTPPNPAQQVNVVFASLTAPRVSEAWRTGVSPNHVAFTASGNFNTADSRLHIGQRAGASKGAEARGQIGETLVFDRILSEGERNELQRLLVKKWMTAPGEEDLGAAAVTVAEGTLRLAPGADAIARLAPLIWYDPSGAANVTTNAAGRVTGLLSKGSKSGMDAVTGISNGGTALLAPQLATGALSYAASKLPMIGIDANNCGLASGATTGISGTAPRTVVGVFARDNNTTAGPITALGINNTAQLYEVGDRQNGIVVGCYGTGNDLVVTPLNPVQQANVFFAANTGAKVNEFWRTGLAPNHTSLTLANTLATVDSRFFIGQRPNTVNRSDFRGQIGELLVFDRLLAESERVDLEDYLARKWMQASGTNNLFAGAVFDVAAGATLDLGGARDNLTVTGSGTVTNGTLGAGFVISPAGDDAVGELALSGVTVAAGAEYRLTLAGDTSDRLLIDGDLGGLTVVPATADEITGRTYVIATGAITQKPALSGFPEKFKLIRQGSDLLLTSIGGTVLLLK